MKRSEARGTDGRLKSSPLRAIEPQAQGASQDSIAPMGLEIEGDAANHGLRFAPPEANTQTPYGLTALTLGCISPHHWRIGHG